MKFLADENVEKPIVESLRQQGFDVRYIAEENRSVNDEAVLALANQESRILITNDKDFGEMAFRLHRVHTGIFLLRFRRDDAEWKAQRLAQFLTQYQKPLIGKFVVLRDTRVRIRSLQS
ncbi:MAG: DUF5615 family PIN-like protein [Candidatus Bipolaricaulota bacterium]|nr:DUF5615 family PIN-like protein [Candidatus Bipolaricaulota bacterium]